MMDFGQNICQTVGGKSVHPVTAVPGGMKFRLTEEARDSYLQQTEEQLEMMTATVNLALDVVTKYWDVVANLAVVPMYYVGQQNNGLHDIYWGDLVVCDPEGKRTIFKKENYLDALGEHYSNTSYASHTYVKSAGYPDGVYTVGPLAMINCNDKFGTPIADSALKEMLSKVGTKVVHNQFAGHWARIIETVSALEQIITLLKDPEICSDKIKTEHVEAKAGRGIGLSEAPRGTLIYDLTSDDDGICTKLNLMVATNHNMGGINKVLKASAKQIFEENALSKVKLPDPILK
jgi:F420-non-reducing hydrogenase large subunit